MYNGVTHGETFRSLPLKLWKKLRGKKSLKQMTDPSSPSCSHQNAIKSVEFGQESDQLQFQVWKQMCSELCEREELFKPDHADAYTLDFNCYKKPSDSMSSFTRDVQYCRYCPISTVLISADVFPPNWVKHLKNQKPRLCIVGFSIVFTDIS